MNTGDCMRSKQAGDTWEDGRETSIKGVSNLVNWQVKASTFSPDCCTWHRGQLDERVQRDLDAGNLVRGDGHEVPIDDSEDGLRGV